MDEDEDPEVYMAMLMAKLDKLEQATSALDEQNSSMRLECDHLKEANADVAQQCTFMDGAAAVSGGDDQEDSDEMEMLRLLYNRSMNSANYLSEQVQRSSPGAGARFSKAMPNVLDDSAAALKALQATEEEMRDQAFEISALIEANRGLMQELEDSGCREASRSTAAASTAVLLAPDDAEAVRARAATLVDEIAMLEAALSAKKKPRGRPSSSSSIRSIR